MNVKQYRSEILRAWAVGATSVEIAADLGLTDAQVRHLVARARRQGDQLATRRNAPSEFVEDDVATLKTMWLDGFTAAEIGRHLGRTRSAILGKINRLGLLDAERTRRVKKYVPPRPAAHQTRVVFHRRAAPVPEGGTKLFADLTIGDHCCRWVTGGDSLADRMACGRPTEIGASYCAGHHGLAYIPNSAHKRPSNPTAYLIRKPLRILDEEAA